MDRARGTRSRRHPGEAVASDAPANKGLLDVAVAAALVLLGALAMAALPEGGALRIALVLPVLFFAPGYLLIQSLMVPMRPPRMRFVHGLVAIGVSPALVGLLALATSVVPGGFRPTPIVVLVTLASLVFAGVAAYRRIQGQTTRRTARSPHRTGGPKRQGTRPFS